MHPIELTLLIVLILVWAGKGSTHSPYRHYTNYTNSNF
jgi:hypothetical protein